MQISVRHELVVPIASGGRTVAHVLLTPLSGPGQTVLGWSIEMPGIETASRFTDAFGNRALLISQPRAEGELTIRATGTVETVDRNGILGRVPGEPVVALYKRRTDLTAPNAEIVEGFAGAKSSGTARLALLHEVMRRVREFHRAAPTDEPPGLQSQRQGTSSEAEPAPEGTDAATFAHAFIGTLRALDLPARYVTGYLADGGRPPALHAWAEAWDDGLGWIGFDPMLGLCPTDRHVRVAAGLDALSTAPIRLVPAADGTISARLEVTAQ